MNPQVPIHKEVNKLERELRELNEQSEGSDDEELKRPDQPSASSDLPPSQLGKRKSRDQEDDEAWGSSLEIPIRPRRSAPSSIGKENVVPNIMSSLLVKETSKTASAEKVSWGGESSIRPDGTVKQIPK
jgi:hypothetical protein